MSGVPFIYNVPKEFFFSTFYKSFGFTGKGQWVVMYCWGAQHPYFTSLIYTCHTSSPAVRHFKPNGISIESSKRKIEKLIMTMAFIHFSVIVISQMRGYIDSSLFCDRVNVIRHFDNIWVRNLLPNSSSEWQQETGDLI